MLDFFALTKPTQLLIFKRFVSFRLLRTIFRLSLRLAGLGSEWSERLWFDCKCWTITVARLVPVSTRVLEKENGKYAFPYVRCIDVFFIYRNTVNTDPLRVTYIYREMRTDLGEFYCLAYWLNSDNAINENGATIRLMQWLQFKKIHAGSK